jgi:hypothetical protein
MPQTAIWVLIGGDEASHGGWISLLKADREEQTL